MEGKSLFEAGGQDGCATRGRQAGAAALLPEPPQQGCRWGCPGPGSRRTSVPALPEPRDTELLPWAVPGHAPSTQLSEVQVSLLWLLTV